MAGNTVLEPHRLFTDLHRVLGAAAGFDECVANERSRRRSRTERVARGLPDLSVWCRSADRSNRRAQDFSLDERGCVRQRRPFRNFLERILVRVGPVSISRRRLGRLLHPGARLDRATLWCSQARHRNGVVSGCGLVRIRGLTDRVRGTCPMGGMARSACAVGNRYPCGRPSGVVRHARYAGYAAASQRANFLARFGAPVVAKQTRAACDLVVFISLLGAARHVGVAAGFSGRSRRAWR